MDPKDGFAVITEAGDSVESVIKTIAGTTDLTEKERDALISGAIDQGLLRRKSDGKLEVIPGKAAPIKKVWSEGNRSLEMLERVNAVKVGLQGIQAVGIAGAALYGSGLAAATAIPVIGEVAGTVLSGWAGQIIQTGLSEQRLPTVKELAVNTAISLGTLGFGKLISSVFNPAPLTEIGLTASTQARQAAANVSIQQAAHEAADIVTPFLNDIPQPAFTVDPIMRAEDVARGVIQNGKYIKNPSTVRLESQINNMGTVSGPYRNFQGMYVIDESGAIIIGKRLGTRMPHPTLIGGENPRVLGAGIVDIRGGKIYSVNNSSGHFKPGLGALDAAQNAFQKLPAQAFHRDFQGYNQFDK